MEEQNRDEDKLKSLFISKNLPIVFDWSMFEGFHLWESATCHNPISRITSKELNHIIIVTICMIAITEVAIRMQSHLVRTRNIHTIKIQTDI
ncbi:hypothetical protein DEO72_LG4g2288 [Vigna unguiculata]|uniref:Uncharacterized protein n=1 Tax=Vigna unguiculata TaxID=3917 RepID=A0A4D6LS73_VIGUN|nr:hypothetical protein DEO72_LG4g2288 [Vigna unguiculata]